MTQAEDDLRLRAAWLYYGHGLTQMAVSDRLGVSRSTVLRLLEEVRARQEIRFWITDEPPTTAALALEIEEAFDLPRAIVVPGDLDPDAGGTRAVGLALGRELVDLVAPNMLIGVGWGRTLQASLQSFSPRQQAETRVISMLGGSADPGLSSAFEYPWRFASRLGAECQLFPSPVVVPSAAVKDALLAEGGMGALMELGQALDLAIYSAGDVGGIGTSLSKRLLPEDAYAEMVARGAVCDVICQFIDSEGRDVSHPVRDRLMSLPLDDLTKAKSKVLAAAGQSRARALVAATKRTAPTLLVIDEPAARAMLDLA